MSGPEEDKKATTGNGPPKASSAVETARYLLQEAGLRFRDFADASSHWLWEMGPDLRFCFISDSIKQITGEDPKDFLGKTRAEIAGPRALTNRSLAENLATMERHEAFSDFIMTRPRMGGGEIHLALSGKPIFGDDGNFAGYRGTARDITAQVNAERSLKNSEARYRSLVDGSIQGILVHRGERILFCNRAGAEFLGFENPEEVCRQNIRSIIPASEWADAKALIKSRLEGHSNTERYERRWVAKDGRILWSETSGQVIDWDGEPAVQVIIVNITDRKKTEEKLITALDEARSATRLKSELVANVSHELRTPLNAIIGFSELLLAGIPVPLAHDQHREYVSDIKFAGQHLLDLINDMLDLSAIEMGKMELANDTVNLDQVITRAIRLVERRAGLRSIQIKAVRTDDQIVISADERRLQQIMINLLTNSMKFSGDETAVEVTSGRNESGDLVISVRDQGIGMTESEIEIALARFGQVRRGEASAHEGTGLGLPLVVELTRLHGGTIEIDSDPGLGTTVRVLLPAYRLVQTPNRLAHG
ncbi:MAG: PAS domain S-box protein [Magnetovibrionaceae bacterium]